MFNVRGGNEVYTIEALLATDNFPKGRFTRYDFDACDKLTQAYDMTWDHLHAYDIFTYKIKYAEVCTGIYGAKKF